MYDILTLQAFFQQFYTDKEGNVPPLSMDSFSYGLTLFDVEMDAPGQSTGQLRINANADFFVTQIFVFGTTTNALNLSSGENIPQLIQLTRAGTSEPFFNAPLAVGNVCASAAFPDRLLEMPKLIKAGSTVTVDVYGTATGSTETFPTLDIVLNGVNVQVFG